ncbi:MAG: helix-turn-helix transcriptional regulator [Oligoflexia bacterium]|nr:helix-turn-helix transcriptional regulator [Oligoflexia bacterium]
MKMVREKLGLTQGDLEGLTQPEVSKIEGRKDLKISNLDKYARSMGMKIRIVLTSEEDEDIRTSKFKLDSSKTVLQIQQAGSRGAGSSIC